MASTKVTFTLDEATLQRLEDAATQLVMPKSEVVREAIQEFHDRLGRLSERERLSMLRAFDEFVPRILSRSPADADREIAEIRRARKSGGRSNLQRPGR
jgi:predicted transcriptional regulator